MIHSLKFLKALEIAPLFRGISTKLVAKSLSHSTLRTLNAGETLLFLGQANNLIYMILSGRLSIQSKESDVEPIAMLGEGECVGEMSILGDGHVSAYVIAATDCKLLALDHIALWDLIDRSHVAAHNMLSILSNRIRMTDQVVAENLENHHGFSGISMVDELTGLYNRHWMYEKFDRCLQRSILINKPSCLVILEMDQFKEFKECYGQLGYDQALRDIAYSVLSCLRPEDQAGHYLGEQFAVFLSSTSMFDACIVAERLRSAISQSKVVLPSGDALPPVSISLGISQTYPYDTLDNLMARADEALRQAIEGGGGCVRCVK